MMHEDSYGSYWNYWSPENPNFFTDFIRVPIALTSNLKEHPRFEDLRKLAELRMKEDLYHSVTLPGGAGQECPGYMSVGLWSGLAEVCRAHLGFDPTTWERFKAAARFRRRISQPYSGGRRMLPMGDTHPGEDGPRPIEVPPEEVAAYVTEELPGFGVIFTSQPGTPDETYLAFKSGPNRGHYHGDQLAFHYCANGKPAAVDHHCSYRPRAGQEHMHNRVAFFTEKDRYLNMDGYERLIAFKASPQVDIAVGQVESDRLRPTTELPPEYWHVEWPMTQLGGTLAYRRTVVFVKGGPRDYFVLRDQFAAPRELGAALCLHFNDPDTLALWSQKPGEGGDTDGSTVFRDAAQDFVKLGVQPGWFLHIGEVATKHTGAHLHQERYQVRGVEAHAVTLDRTAPVGSKQPYVLLRPRCRQEGQNIAFDGLTLFCAQPAQCGFALFPWFHANGGPEATQGARLETKGARGQYISVLYPGRAPAMSSLPGGVKVGDDQIVFSGELAGREEARTLVSVKRGGTELISLAGNEIDFNRSQGEIGLFVPDAGYPFGEIPDWLLRQRAKKPEWHKEYLEVRGRLRDP
jgi:hypothetical protein